MGNDPLGPKRGRPADVTRAWTETAFFNVKNLNNEPLRFFEGRGDRPVQREFYLQTFEFGVRTHF